VRPQLSITGRPCWPTWPARAETFVGIRQSLAPLRPQAGRDDLRSFDWYSSGGKGIEDPGHAGGDGPGRRPENVTAALAPDGQGPAVAYADGDVQLWTRGTQTAGTLKNPPALPSLWPLPPTAGTLAVGTSPEAERPEKENPATRCNCGM